MKTFLFISALISAVILEVSFSSFWTVKGGKPDFVLVFVLFWIISADFKKIWPAIFLAGVALDFLSALPFGIFGLSLLLVCFFIDWLKRNVFSGTNYPIICLLIFLGTLFYDLSLVCLGKLFRLNLFFDLRYLPVELVFNLLTAAVFYGILTRFAPRS